MLKLSRQDRKLLDEITTFPWDPDKYRPLGQSLLEGVQRAEQTIAGGYYRNLRPCWPELSDSALRSLCFDTAVLGYTAWALHGIARRFIHNSPAELSEFGAMAARKEWVLEGHANTRPGRARDFEILWSSALWALAVGDYRVIERMLETLPYPLPRNTDKRYLSTFPTYYPLFSDAVFGVLRRETSTVEEAVHALSKRKLRADESGLVLCLRGIVERSPALVAEGLAAQTKSTRRARSCDPHYKLLGLGLHGAFELCRSVDPRLIVEWDTTHLLPWDAELHDWRRQGGDPLRDADLSMIPADLEERLTELPTPTWWQELSPT
ncbi:MAG TPA: hypothetical protein VML55_12365 [Planctomycetaceae bacterium]|nr:hypothetical protein [Planctomycetaceae bacterium]